MDDHQRIHHHGRCDLISIQSDEGGVLEYRDDEINRGYSVLKRDMD